MKAKIKPRIDLENRTKLEEVIPLSTPFVLQVEPTNLCNMRCRFCPVGDLNLIKQSGIKQGMLTMDLFKKAIDSLSDFESNFKTLRLYSNGEPLLNKHFYEMVKYAEKSRHFESIDTTTNGLLLTPERIGPIIEAGIDKINISVNGVTSKQYFETTQTRVNFDEFLNNLRYLYENRGKTKILIKSISEFYNEKDKKRFFDIFSSIADYIFLENLTDPWPHYKVEESTGIKSTHSAHSDKIEPKYVCSPIFYTLTMNFDGTVSLCCVDWDNNLIIGDVNHNSLKEIWDSDVLFNYQMQHLKGERFNNPICRECNQISQCVYDNIDQYRLELADRLQASRVNQVSNRHSGGI